MLVGQGRYHAREFAAAPLAWADRLARPGIDAGEEIGDRQIEGACGLP
jgi:hypothetical protein